MRFVAPLTLLFLIPLALACGGESDSGDSRTDAAPDEGLDSFTADTSGEPDSVDDAVDDTEDAGPCTSLGCACEDDLDCASGYCLDSPEGGRVCSEFCDEQCSDPAYDCRLLVNSGGDAARLCVPGSDAYCDECDVVSDCGDLRAACYTLAPDTSVCVTPCDDETLCPSGATCNSLVIDGDESTYCVPEDGVCDGCIDEDGDFHGVGPDCFGPDQDDEDDTVYDGAPERCDGRDNDGNGEIDEGFDLDNSLEHCGACNTPCEVEDGVAACVEGICVVDGCPDGFEDCDSDAENGCEVDLADPVRCGTCELPDGAPGDSCGTCETGTWTCGEDDLTTCEGDAGDDVLNACGGCESLDDVPGEVCGTCETGEWTCTEDGGLSCEGDLGEDAENPCGGCDELEGEPGSACGTCDTGVWVCAAEEVLSCIGDTGDEVLNACGGCGEIEVAPGTECGSCGLDEFTCDGADATVCSGDTASNECGGCLVLPGVVGESCGSCLVGVWTCDGPDGMACAGDPGPDAPSSCGVQIGPIQIGAAIGGFAGPGATGRWSPANTIRGTTDDVSLEPFETE
jgi:hypothetical protein